MSNVIDIFQNGYNLYKFTSDGKVSKLKHKLYGYCLDEDISYFQNKNFIIDNKVYKDIFNRNVRKVYIKSFYGFNKELKDKLFGTDINYLYYKKEHNIEYSDNMNDYRIWYWDIEVSIGKERNNNTPENPKEPITTISWYDTINKQYYIIGWHKEETKNIEKYKYETKIVDNEKVTYIYVKDEYNLLKIFLSILRKYKPIMLIGWFSNFFDTPYVIKRMEVNGFDTKLLSPINRNVRYYSNNYGGRSEWKINIPGLYSIELNQLIERYISVKFLSMSLNNVAKKLGLGQKIKVNLNKDYINNFKKFMEYNINDVRLTMKINDYYNITSFMIFVHHLTDIPFDQLLSSSLVVRNAIIKTSDGIVVSKKRPFSNYQGAIVLEPKYHGVLKNICTLDANSMYPTSMITFNISPDTFICSYKDIVDNKDNIDNYIQTNISQILGKKLQILDNIDKNDVINYVKQVLKYNNVEYIDTGYSDELLEQGYLFMHHNYKVGIYTKYLKEVYDNRKAVKKEMKKYDKHDIKYYQLNALNMALKLELNTTYGANGYSSFFLYDPRIAETVTYFARRLLTYAIDYLLQKGYETQYGDSVSKDTKIYIKKDNKIKQVEIQDLFNEKNTVIRNGKEYCYIDNIYTPSVDPKTGRQSWQKIKYVMRHKKNPSKKMYRIFISKREFVDVTEDHSVMIYNNVNRRRKNKLDLIIPSKPVDLQNKHSSLIYINSLGYNNKSIYTKEGILLWEFLGYFIGDGSSWLTNGNRYYISLATGLDQEEIINKLIHPLQKLRIINHYWIGKHGDITMNGRIVKTVDKIFYQNKIKDINVDLLKIPYMYQKAFLRGYFSADGTSYIFNNKTCVALTSVNIKFVKIVQKMLFQNNIISNIIKESNKNRYKGKESNTYSHHVRIHSRYIDRFFTDIGFVLDRKNNNYRRINHKKINFVHITKIEEIQYNDYVYDIEVENTHTFFGNNILLHNTDSLFILLHTKEDNYDKCIQEGESLNKEVNDNIQDLHTNKYISTTLPQQYNNYLGFKLEHILHYIYFSDSKKRYFGIEYPDKNGIEESYVRGMNVIRKDTPEIMKKILKDLIYKMLKGQISKNDFNDIKTKLQNTPLEQIGIIKSFNKNFSNYKVLPQHVRAVLFAKEKYNVNINNFDKPFMFYVKIKNTMKKYKYYDGVIALNQKDLHLLKEDPDIEIDYDKFIEKQILEPLKEFNYIEELDNILNVLRYQNKHSKYISLFDF